VIVAAYDRKQYVVGAVKSALNQTLPRDLYEVIVVKNFRDDLIDAKLMEWGVTNLYSEKAGLGAKYWEALQVAKGDVISFLDDDDEFVPDKLEAVRNAFAMGVDYYHNGQVFVNEAGVKLGEHSVSALVRGQEGKRRYARWLFEHAANGNNSSISIRRDLLTEDLTHINIGVDNYLFITALLKANTLADDPRPLTVYRRHGNQSTSQIDSLNNHVIKRCQSSRSYASDNEKMLNLVKGTPYEFAAKSFVVRSKISASIYCWLMNKSCDEFKISAGDALYLALNPVTVGSRVAAIYVYMMILAYFVKPLRRYAAKFEFISVRRKLARTSKD
ncbi:MAG: glycosyltransferase family 2 protein, partial [Thermoprotei archaeon]